jgi:hypothetical protein
MWDSIKSTFNKIVQFIFSFFNRNKEMRPEETSNKEKLFQELTKLSLNSLYFYIFQNIHLNEYTEDGLKEIKKRCNALTDNMRIKLGNYKKNRLYREMMASHDVKTMDEFELEKLYIKLMRRSEEIRLDLKRKDLNGPVNEFVIK